MLVRCVVTIWGAWLGALGLATALTASGIWTSNPILPVGLSVLMFAAGLGLVIAAAVRLIRGPRRDRALAGLLVGTAPFWFLAGHILMAVRPAFDRHVPPRWPTKVFSPLAMPLADLESRWFYPERTPGKWVTMVGAKASDAQAQVAAMDRHVDASLARLGQSATWPIVWYRGPLFGLRKCAIYDRAIGSEIGSSERRGDDGLTDLDRHEVAHCVITRNCTARSDPPRVLMEGWAQANQGTPAEELAATAWADHEKGRSLTLRELVAPDWYWYSGWEAYNQGAPLVNYLLRVYGPERFLKLYTTCRQATFESDLRACLGVGLDELDTAYWTDIEPIARRAGPPVRHWLKHLRLAPGVDPAAWETFLAEYFAAAERMLAPYDHVRLTIVWQSVSDAQCAQPDHHEIRHELLRSGPFARLRKTDQGDELEYLANPNRSIQARRNLGPPAKPWTIRKALWGSLERSYRSVLHSIDFESTLVGEPAVHGGMILLGRLRQYTDIGYSNDYEVVKLQTTIHDGHRLVTLHVRTSPEVKSVDREDYTFVFDADNLFVVQSEHGVISGRLSRSGLSEYECRYEYSHEEGRPILRALTTTGLDPTPPKWSTRLEVTECRFGPIPDSEFSPESFLARLKPDGIIHERDQVEEPPTATWFDRYWSTTTWLDWYWVAFVLGGFHLAGGSSIALESRDRDRRVL
jgi:hypothetical protein